jgi:hypothetical protein
MTVHTTKLTVDPATGDLMLDLNDEMLAALAAKVGDQLKWEINEETGTVTITKAKQEAEPTWVMVEAVSMFRMRYMVKNTNPEHPEWALDTVVMNEAKEFSQQFLDETIVSHRVISQAEALLMCDLDNDYHKDSPEQLKLDLFFTDPDAAKEKAL